MKARLLQLPPVTLVWRRYEGTVHLSKLDGTL